MAASSSKWQGTITLTACDCGENNYGMQKIGQLAAKGLSYEQLLQLKTLFESLGAQCELVNLNAAAQLGTLAGTGAGDTSACVLVIRGGINALGKGGSRDGVSGADALFEEQKSLLPVVDRKAKMRGKVVNKHARGNLCFAQGSQEPDYASGKGRIVAYSEIAVTHRLIERLESLLKKVGIDLQLITEANYYDKYDPTTGKTAQTGIGFHGDAERRLVFAFRLSTEKEMALEYQWFHEGRPQGQRVRLTLGHGDMYIMGAKAVGFDWKKRKIWTLRHAAGAPKYLQIKQKRPVPISAAASATVTVKKLPLKLKVAQ